jgi:hypothetical protein
MPRVAFRLPISCLRMSCVVHKPLPFFLLPPLSYLSKRATFSSLVCRGAMLIWWCLPAGSVVGDGRTYFSVRKAASFILSDLSFLHRRGSIVVSVPCIAHCYWPCCTFPWMHSIGHIHMHVSCSETMVYAVIHSLRGMCLSHVSLPECVFNSWGMFQYDIFIFVLCWLLSSCSWCTSN